MILRTERLLLRDFRPSDLVVYREIRSDPAFQRFYAPEEVSLERSAELLETFMAWAREEPRRRFQLAIEEPQLGLLGSCGVRIIDPAGREASFGCELGRPHQGQGYALEAASALIGFAFDRLGIDRVHAETLAANAPALALARELGMRVVERHSAFREIRDRSVDTVTLVVRASEWPG